MKQLHSKIRMIILIAAAVMILFSPRLVVFAGENFTSDYSQTEYTEEDGFESGEANCIVQSSSGYIWIGTDSGLHILFHIWSLPDEASLPDCHPIFWLLYIWSY